MRIYSFVVNITGHVDFDEELAASLPKNAAMGSAMKVRSVAEVSLGDVVVYSKDVTKEMSTSAPSRHEEVEYAIMHEFAERLRKVLDMHEAEPGHVRGRISVAHNTRSL